jgi:hypothetical protein
MTALARIVFALAAVGVVACTARGASAQPVATPSTAPVAGKTSGMKQYVDAKYGFSFWCPAGLPIAVTAGHDDKSFPGGTAVETVQVGPAGGVAVHVVNSPQSTITDEPNGHAAPIAQTRLFLDAAMQMWMLAYPEGDGSGKPVEAKTADLSSKTIGGLPMVATGARFDTTIIPLSKTRFAVVQDGGGSTFTKKLAQTVARKGAKVASATQAAALQAEAAAFKKQ